MDIILKKRFLAACIDGLLVCIIYFTTYNTLHASQIPYATFIAVLNCYILTIIFPVFVWHGQSIGKRLLKIMIATTDNCIPHRRIIFVRELCKSILFTSINFFTLALFLIFPLINNKQQALHDLFIGTNVTEAYSRGE